MCWAKVAMKSLLALARRRAGQARRGRLRPASRLKRHTHSIIQHIQLSTNKCIRLIFKLKALNQPEGGLQCPQLPLSCHRHVAQHATAAPEIFCQQVVIVWSRGSLGATWRLRACPSTSSGLVKKIHCCVPRKKSRGGGGGCGGGSGQLLTRHKGRQRVRSSQRCPSVGQRV